MKANIIALVALSALTLAPVFGAPENMSTTTSSKRAAAPAAATQKKSPAAKEKTSPEKQKSSPAQNSARELAADLTPTQKSKMLTLLNEGSPKDLAVIKGVSKTRAAAIEKARPFKSLEEVVLVSGIGQKTVSEMVSHARTLTTSSRKASSSASKKPKAKS